MISHKKGSGEYNVSCDSCSEGYIDIETDDFMEVVKQLKAEGWQIEKQPNGEWEHYCPDCD